MYLLRPPKRTRPVRRAGSRLVCRHIFIATRFCQVLDTVCRRILSPVSVDGVKGLSKAQVELMGLHQRQGAVTVEGALGHGRTSVERQELGGLRCARQRI